MGRLHDILDGATDGILAALCIFMFAAISAAAPLDLNYLASVDAAISHDRVLVVFVGAPSQRIGDCEAVGVDELPGYTTGDIVVSAPAY
jgi:hypothetical protein